MDEKLKSKIARGIAIIDNGTDRLFRPGCEQQDSSARCLSQIVRLTHRNNKHGELRL